MLEPPIGWMASHIATSPVPIVPGRLVKVGMVSWNWIAAVVKMLGVVGRTSTPAKIWVGFGAPKVGVAKEPVGELPPPEPLGGWVAPQVPAELYWPAKPVEVVQPVPGVTHEPVEVQTPEAPSAVVQLPPATAQTPFSYWPVTPL